MGQAKATTWATTCLPGAASDGFAGIVPLIPLRARAWRRVVAWIIVTMLVASFLLAVSAHIDLAPDIGADNAYIFLAADRLYEGLGPTATPPRAPLQPWTWSRDWQFLTQWPVGYPILLCAVRLLTGASTAGAAVTLGVVCCAVALVGWFVWIRSCLPRRLPASLIAAVGAGASFSVANLVNPSSDGVLLALTPIILLLVCQSLASTDEEEETFAPSPSPSLIRLAASGLLAGMLVWIRYAGVFVAIAIGLFLLVECFLTKRVRFRQVAVYAAASILPIVALLLMNRTLGGDGSMQQQLNLGGRIGFHLDPAMLATMWSQFTRQTLYAHRPEAVWAFAIGLPAAALGVPLVRRSTRRWLRAFFGSPRVMLSAMTVSTLLVFLLSASVLFHDKYDYVGQARYYQPIRPLYFLLFVGPVLCLPWRMLRVVACIPLVAACFWFVNQDARRTVARWQGQPRPTTDYGRWARRFEPNNSAIYSWLRTQRGSDLVVFSNFHEEIALETWIPACPTPNSPVELNAWCDRIKASRGADDLRVLFVLDPNNDYREYYLPPPGVLVKRFGLCAVADAPQGDVARVFAPMLMPRHDRILR